VSELVSLRWDQVDLRQGLLHVARLKHGIASVHPLATPNNKRVERRAPLLVITGLDPVISRGTVLEQITGSSPVMTIGGEPG
jgi:hypothetical protein